MTCKQNMNHHDFLKNTMTQEQHEPPWHEKHTWHMNNMNRHGMKNTMTHEQHELPWHEKNTWHMNSMNHHDM